MPTPVMMPRHVLPPVLLRLAPLRRRARRPTTLRPTALTVLLLPVILLAATTALAGMRPAALHAQQPRTADHIADSTAIAAHARALTAAATTETERAAAIYEWVARNVAYDAGAAVAGLDSHETAEAVWRHRLAVCGGFVAIYGRLAREVGLTAEPIHGYAKGFDYRDGQSTKKNNHAWLAVRVEGSWGLVDPTWGAGNVAGAVFQPAFTWAYFLVDPDALILSHMPEEAKWQLVRQRLSRRDFERMPAVARALLDIGFSPAGLRATALTAGVRGFPTVAPQGSAARVVRAPLAGTLQAAQPVEVEILWPDAAEMVLVSGDVWTPLARDGDVFRGRADARAGTVWVIGRTGPDPAEFLTLLHYRVE